jgi:hypothetical protein
LTLPPAPGASAPNKANFPASAGKDGGRPGQGRCRRRAGSCETKPISGGAKGRVSALWGRSYGESYIRQVPAKQTQLRRMGHSRTIATAGDDAIRRRGNRAKQSQFLAVSGEDAHPTNRSKRAKQSQFPAGAGSGAEGCCTNKPNSRHYADPEVGVPGRANCAKQSQLGPVSGNGRGPAGWGLSAGTIVSNKPSFRCILETWRSGDMIAGLPRPDLGSSFGRELGMASK